MAKKYFLVCFSCVLMGLLVLGGVMFIITTHFFENDKYDSMKRNAKVAASVTANNYVANNYTYVDQATITSSYKIIGDALGAEFLLVRLDGGIIYYSGAKEGEDYSEVVIPEDVVNKALAEEYSSTGIMVGITQKPVYVVGMPVVAEDKSVAVIYAITSADDLMILLKDIFRIFTVVSIAVLFVALILISYVTSRMVKPIKHMVAATHSFSNGDFTARIPVSSYDEIGQLSMAFNDMASALSVNETSRRSFIANVSHELKTPMTTIGGFVDGILDGTIPDEKRDQYLQIVSVEVKRLSRLVHSMLDTARVEGGEMTLKPTAFDISEIVRQTIFNFEVTIEEKELEIKGLETDKIMVEADEDLMHQVVYNLLENAVKFVNPNGYIAIEYEEKKGMTYVCIRNSGEGLTNEDAAQIFDRFYKSDRSRTSSNSGVGLGLHIVKAIIRHHSGEIVARSEDGEYTEFEFYIPTKAQKNK